MFLEFTALFMYLLTGNHITLTFQISGKIHFTNINAITANFIFLAAYLKFDSRLDSI
jgi:hypothetical protein